METILRQLREQVANARPMPLSASSMVNKDELLGLVDEAITVVVLAIAELGIAREVETVPVIAVVLQLHPIPIHVDAAVTGRHTNGRPDGAQRAVRWERRGKPGKVL